MNRCRGIVPPYLLERLSGVPDQDIVRIAQATLAQDELYRAARRAGTTGPRREPAAPPVSDAGPHRTIDDSGGTTTLPGRTVRGEGAPATGDAAADEAYDGLGATWTLYDTA